jgi:hypothetical protein
LAIASSFLALRIVAANDDGKVAFDARGIWNCGYLRAEKHNMLARGKTNASYDKRIMPLRKITLP